MSEVWNVQWWNNQMSPWQWGQWKDVLVKLHGGIASSTSAANWPEGSGDVAGVAEREADEDEAALPWTAPVDQWRWNMRKRSFLQKSLKLQIAEWELTHLQKPGSETALSMVNQEDGQKSSLVGANAPPPDTYDGDQEGQK